MSVLLEKAGAGPLPDCKWAKKNEQESAPGKSPEAPFATGLLDRRI